MLIAHLLDVKYKCTPTRAADPALIIARSIFVCLKVYSRCINPDSHGNVCFSDYNAVIRNYLQLYVPA